jgi:AmiR/NasT family two-component response regulator
LTGLGRRHAPSQYPDQERDNVNQAVAAWHRVGLAQGILMTRRQLKADQAFALLKRESQNTHVKLRTIAQTVIQTGDLPVDR